MRRKKWEKLWHLSWKLESYLIETTFIFVRIFTFHIWNEINKLFDNILIEPSRWNLNWYFIWMVLITISVSDYSCTWNEIWETQIQTHTKNRRLKSEWVNSSNEWSTVRHYDKNYSEWMVAISIYMALSQKITKPFITYSITYHVAQLTIAIFSNYSSDDCTGKGH